MNNKVFKQRIIPQNWSLKKVSEIAKTGSGGTPLSTCKEYYDGGNIPWINSGEVGQNSIKQTSNFITKAGMENSSAKLFPAGSVLLALYGATAGKTSFLEINATTNQAICAIMPKKGYDAKFIKYYLDALYSYLVGVSTGSARDNLNQNGIQDLEIPFPSETTQKSIAKVLSDLDAKIELNNKINRELEAMAKTLYDYWFVQFDFPNEQGKPYKSSGGKMVYNTELKREIPEGWEVKRIEDFCRIFTGKKDVNQALEIGKYKFFSCSPNYKFSNEKLHEGKAILISGNGSYTGRTIFVDEGFDLYQRTYACVNNTDTDILSYLYFSIKRFLSLKIGGGTHGSAIPYIVYDDIAKETFAYNFEIVSKFQEIINPTLSNMKSNDIQTTKLTELRDWLLPMLMNGQVTVKEAEERLSMAAEPSVEYKKG